MSGAPLDELRQICMSLPEVEERASHGEPSWFIAKGRQFATLDDHHHGEDRLAFWCAAPEGAQRSLVEADPGQFFVPPYVGHRGWLGVRLDRSPDWKVIREVVLDAYLEVAPRRLARLITDEGSSGKGLLG